MVNSSLQGHFKLSFITLSIRNNRKECSVKHAKRKRKFYVYNDYNHILLWF